VKNRSIKTYVVSLFGALFLLTACGPKEIPDSDMQAIIHDIFLVNAYYGLYEQSHTPSDSVDIYTPILKKYGYDAEDFRYSMDRMALKKSSRLSELIDAATADIKEENNYYEGRARIALRVDTLMGQYYQDTVLQRPDSLWFRDIRKKDTLSITLPVEPGTYRILYGFQRDTTDKGHLTMRYRLKDTTGKFVLTNSRTLQQGQDYRKMDVTFDAGADADSLLLILADYPSSVKNAGLRIDSLMIIHHPPLDSVRSIYWKDQFNRYSHLEYLPDYESIPQDSGTLYLVPPLRPDTARRTDL